jgi:hypothetical protein
MTKKHPTDHQQRVALDSVAMPNKKRCGQLDKRRRSVGNEVSSVVSGDGASRRACAAFVLALSVDYWTGGSGLSHPWLFDVSPSCPESNDGRANQESVDGEDG